MFAEKVDEIQMMYRCMESFESDNNDREVKMKISTKGRYAIKLMLDLATYYNGEPVKIKDIARRQHISDKYLEQIVAILNKASLVKKYPWSAWRIHVICFTGELYGEADIRNGRRKSGTC